MSDETAKLIVAELLAEVRSDGVVVAGPSDLDRRAASVITSLLSQLDATRAERDAGADILRSLLRAEYESAGYGLHDCIDNDGQAYQSDYLDKQIKRAEAYLAALKHQGAET